MRNERGITMIALIIMIILMLVLVGTGVFTGIDAYKTMEAQTFIAQMKVVREKIYVIREEYKSWDKYTGDNIYEYIKEKYTITETKDGGEVVELYSPKELSMYNLEIQNKFLENIDKTDIKNEFDREISNYYYFTADDLNTAFGLSNLDINVFINFDTGTFIEENGVDATNFAGKTDTYYVLDELVDDQSGNFGSKVEDVTSVTQEPLKVENISLLENRVTPFDPAKSTVATKINIKVNKIFSLENTSTDTISLINEKKPDEKIAIAKGNITLNETDKTNIEIVIDNKYIGNIYFEVKIGEETVKTSSIEIVKVNEPVIESTLSNSIQKVGWNGFTEVELKDPTNINWYNYAQEDKRWANIKMPDGSYYVWIPRFAYYVDGEDVLIEFLQYSSSDKNVCYKTFDGKNINNSSETGGKLYHVPQAFTVDDTKKYTNGEYTRELPGIWVSKYEGTIIANDVTSESESYPIVFRPFSNLENNVSVNYEKAVSNVRKMMHYLDKLGFKDITYPSGRDTIAGNLDLPTPLPTGYPSLVENIDTHLIKNSEWAALAYLSYSKYGSSGNPVNSNLRYTGGETEKFNESSIETSSTGTAYGVFDLTNNKPEFVAAVDEDVAQNGSLKFGTSKSWITIYPDTKPSTGTSSVHDGMVELEDEWLTIDVTEYFDLRSTLSTNKNILTRGGKRLFDYKAVNYQTTTEKGEYGVRAVLIMK